MRAVILAAGTNNRLQGHISVPKVLLKIGNDTFLERHVNSLCRAGLSKDDIHVVVGYDPQLVQQYRQYHTQVLTDPALKGKDNASTVHIALSRLLEKDDQRPIIIMDGDLVYDSRFFSELAKSPHDNILVTEPTPYNPALRDEIILQDNTGRVTTVHIPKGGLDESFSGKELYRFAGILKLGAKAAAALRDAIAHSGYEIGWYTIPLPQLIKDHEFHNFKLPQLAYYFDVDTPDDLKRLQDVEEKERYHILTAGPVNLTPTVKASLHYSEIGHREEEFSKVHSDIRPLLLSICGANSTHYDSFIVGGSGTAALETVFNSGVPQDKKILVIDNGGFGTRIAEICKIHKQPYDHLQYAWGEPILLADVKTRITNKDIYAVAVVHMETSTGMVNPIHELGKLCKEHHKKLIVDSMSGLACDPLSMTADNIDILIANTNKGFGGAPVLSFVCYNTTILADLTHNTRKTFYLDFPTHVEYARHNQTPTTPAIPLYLMMRQAARELLTEGVAERIARYRANNKHLHARLAAQGFKFQLEEQHRSNAMLNILLPKNIPFKTLHEQAKQHRFIIYPGKGPLDGKIFHVANIGTTSIADIDRFCDCIAHITTKTPPHYP